MQQYIISKHSYFNFKGIHMNKIAAFQFLILTFLFTSKGITQTCTVGNACLLYTSSKRKLQWSEQWLNEYSRIYDARKQS